MATNKQVHVYITGRVQGVGFRAHTRKNARRLNITGWVKNLVDGRVEAVFAGREDKVEAMLEVVESGPSFAQVKNVKVEEEEYQKQFSKFRVRY